MMKSSLVIQVPFKSQAQELKREFNRRYESEISKLVHGSLSDTWGVAIDFKFWFFSAPIYLTGVIMADNSMYEKVTGIPWTEGRYLETWNNKTLEIPYTELILRGARYYVDDIYLSLGTRKIYKVNEKFDTLLMTNSDITLLTGRDTLKMTPGIMTGIEKLWRRGFLEITEDQLSTVRSYCQ